MLWQFAFDHRSRLAAFVASDRHLYDHCLSCRGFRSDIEHFSDPDKFVKADPFPFLFTALIILVFGPGLLSIDALMKQILRRREKTKLGV
jgi:hypothetical protein